MASTPDMLLASRIRGPLRRRMAPRAVQAGVCSALALTIGLPALGKVGDGYFRTGYEDMPRYYHPVTNSISAGVRAEIPLDAEINPDLDDASNDDQVAVEPEVFVGAAWQPTEKIDVVVDTELSRKFYLEQPGDRDPRFRLQLRRAYAALHEPLPGTTLVLGRQNFVDERKWIWEEPLDGARVFWERDRFLLDLAAARDGFARRDLLERRQDDGGNYFWGAGSYALSEDSVATGYALYINDHEDTSEDLLFLGLQSFGELHKDIDYWLDSAVVSGEEDNRDVLGFGVDIGATWETDLPLEPAFTLGFAFGSGDDGTGTDSAFRQTGLEENSDKFAGLASFDYYGEVMDPELSNLLIATAGVGIRPTEDTSADLVYHHYRQANASDELRNAALDADPTGDSAALGNELDLVLGWRANDRLRLEAAAGVFLPGDAFEEDDPAFSVSLEVKFDL